MPAAERDVLDGRDDWTKDGVELRREIGFTSVKAIKIGVAVFTHFTGAHSPYLQRLHTVR